MATGTRRARSLGAALKAARDRTKVSGREVSRQLEISHTKVQRWETGETAPSPEDVASYLAVIGVTGAERDRILSLARTSDESDWLMSGPPGISAQLASVMDCERTALRITEWAPLVIPGLLQTSDYARSVISRGSGDLSATEVDTRVMVRIARRDALTRRNPVELHAIVGVLAIHGRIGGAEVMADQLRHLDEMARRENVTVQALNLDGEWSPAHVGQFIIYEFDGTPPVVYLEHYRSGAFLVDQDDVATYQTAAEEIRREAMSPDETAGLIASVIPTMETT